MKNISKLLLLLLLVSCSKEEQPQPMGYKLSTGKVVVCESHHFYPCGMTFTECNTGKEYYCQTNVEYVEYY